MSCTAGKCCCGGRCGTHGRSDPGPYLVRLAECEKAKRVAAVERERIRTIERDLTRAANVRERMGVSE